MSLSLSLSFSFFFKPDLFTNDPVLPQSALNDFQLRLRPTAIDAIEINHPQIAKLYTLCRLHTHGYEKSEWTRLTIGRNWIRFCCCVCANSRTVRTTHRERKRVFISNWLPVGRHVSATSSGHELEHLVKSSSRVVPNTFSLGNEGKE